MQACQVEEFNKMLKNKRALVVAVVLIVITMIFIFGILAENQRGASIDSINEDDETVLIDNKSAVIKEGEELFSALNNVESYLLISNDLYAFGKTSFKKYQNDYNGVIGFMVEEVETGQNGITTTGRFGASRNKIEITSRVTNTTVINSVKNVSTGAYAEEGLPSNSAKNIFVAKLPIENKDYVIDYLADSDTFIINVFNSVNNDIAAESVIKSELRLENLSDVKIVKYGVVEQPYDNGF